MDRGGDPCGTCGHPEASHGPRSSLLHPFALSLEDVRAKRDARRARLPRDGSFCRNCLLHGSVHAYVNCSFEPLR